jgi:hypothetical protein
MPEKEIQPGEAAEEVVYIMTVTAGHGFALTKDLMEIPAFIDCTSVLFDADIIGWKLDDGKIIIRCCMPALDLQVRKNLKLTINADVLIKDADAKFNRRIEGRILGHARTGFIADCMDCALDLDETETSKMAALLQSNELDPEAQKRFRGYYSNIKKGDDEVKVLGFKLKLTPAALLAMAGIMGLPAFYGWSATKANDRETCRLLADGLSMQDGNFHWFNRPTPGKFTRMNIDRKIRECNDEFKIDVTRTMAEEAVMKTLKQRKTK